MNIKKLIRSTLFGVMLYIIQLLLAPLPNIELVSLSIVIIALHFDKEALFASVIYTFLATLTWGFGPWVIGYYIAWPTLAMATMMVKRLTTHWKVLSTLLGVYGLLFGMITAIPYLFTSGLEFTILYWMQGIYFDLIHGVSNFVIALLIGEKVEKRLGTLF